MTVIRPNSISGITSLTAHRGSIDFYAHDGSAARFDNINSNVTSGVSTFASLNITGDLDVGGALTYEDVTNIDSVGVIARSGIHITAGNVGIGTDNPTKSLSILSSQSVMLLLTGTTSTARIGFNVPTTTNNPTIGVTNGNDLQIRTGASERLRITSDGKFGLGTETPDKLLTVSGENTVARFKSSTSYVDLLSK